MAILSFFLGRKIDSLEKEVNRLFDTFATTFNGEGKGIAFIQAVEIHENYHDIDLKVESQVGMLKI